MTIRTLAIALVVFRVAVAIEDNGVGGNTAFDLTPELPDALMRSHPSKTISPHGRALEKQILLATAGFGHVGGANVNTRAEKKHASLPTRQAALLGAWLAWPAVAALVAGIVIFLYWPRGTGVICSVLAYVLFLSSIKLTVKFIFVEYAFNYPKFVCMTHFLCGYVAALVILIHRAAPQHYRKPLQGVIIPTTSEFFFEILPIALGFATSIAANNMALVFSSAAFTEIVGCTTPIFSVMAMKAKGMPVDKWSMVPVALVIAGCSVSITGEVHFSAAGMALCFIANAGRAVKGVLQQRIMSNKGKHAMDPVNLLAWMCLPSCLLMLIWSLVTEGGEPFVVLATSTNRMHVLMWIGISAVNATALNLAQLFVTKEIGVVGSQLTAQSKSVLTMLGAVILFNEVVTPVEWAGFVVVLFGVYLHTRLEQKG